MTTPPKTGSPPIHPVILCGGSGTRLWPLSRRSYPKQFTKLTGAQSLFQATARRMTGPGFAAPVVVTGDPFRFIVTEQLAAEEIAPQAVLIEPAPRNTAPAILAAALWLEETEPGAILLAAPADHVLPDTDAFRLAIATARPAAEEGQIVAFGVTPERAETGYGYLELARPGATGVQPLKRFVEKPGPEAAQEMLEAGTYLWNAGLYLARADSLIAAFEAHAPHLVDDARAAVAGRHADLGFTRLEAAAWDRLASVSVDYAVMEKASNIMVMPYAGHWNDLGAWDVVWSESRPDAQGNVTSDNALAIACRDTLLRSEAEGLQLVGLGLEGIIAVAMGDGVLVADKSRAQEVKEAVAALKAQDVPQAEAFPVEHRPWGRFERLIARPGFQVKRIVVSPGAALSLQSHQHRAEHWVVVDGTARVTVAGEISEVQANQSIFVPQGAVHRLENPGTTPLTVIEVQTGSYLGEDDITRLEDGYARV